MKLQFDIKKETWPTHLYTGKWHVLIQPSFLLDLLFFEHFTPYLLSSLSCACSPQPTGEEDGVGGGNLFYSIELKGSPSLAVVKRRQKVERKKQTAFCQHMVSQRHICSPHVCCMQTLACFPVSSRGLIICLSSWAARSGESLNVMSIDPCRFCTHTAAFSFRQDRGMWWTVE